MKSQIVFCDDIREEKSNKHILIGVYGGEMNVNNGPTVIPISLWIQLLDLPPGHHSFKVLPRKVIGRQRTDLGVAEGEFDAVPDGVFAIALPGLPLHVDSDCTLMVSLIIDADKEIELGRLQVRAVFAQIQ
jgi:hypothetical protein